TDKECAPLQTLISLGKASQGDCSQEGQKAGHNKVSNLNPSEIAKGHKTERMASDIKSLAREDLGGPDDNIYRSGNHAAGKHELDEIAFVHIFSHGITHAPRSPTSPSTATNVDPTFRPVP